MTLLLPTCYCPAASFKYKDGEEEKVAGGKYHGFGAITPTISLEFINLGMHYKEKTLLANVTGERGAGCLFYGPND